MSEICDGGDLQWQQYVPRDLGSPRAGPREVRCEGGERRGPGPGGRHDRARAGRAPPPLPREGRASFKFAPESRRAAGTRASFPQRVRTPDAPFFCLAPFFSLQARLFCRSGVRSDGRTAVPSGFDRHGRHRGGRNGACGGAGSGAGRCAAEAAVAAAGTAPRRRARRRRRRGSPNRSPTRTRGRGQPATWGRF